MEPVVRTYYGESLNLVTCTNNTKYSPQHMYDINRIKDLQDDERELKEALANQEQYTKSVCDQNNKLIDKVAAMEEDHGKAASLIGDMKLKVAVSVTSSHRRVKVN